MFEIPEDQNPFTDDYFHRELEFYGVNKNYQNGNVKLVNQTLGQGFFGGELREYFNKSMRFDDNTIPVLLIDDKIWMSITWMEVQSMFLPILYASGRVATCGLGMGYYALRVAAKDEVDEVIVYEQNPDVIRFFKDHFSDRPYYDKIKIVEGDARKLLRGEQFDFVFSDIYPTLGCDDALEDMTLFTENNDNEIGEYWFWGIEKLILDAWIHHEIIDGDGVMDIGGFMLRSYFSLWSKEPYTGGLKGGDGPECKKSNLYEPYDDEEYISRGIEQIQEYVSTRG